MADFFSITYNFTLPEKQKEIFKLVFDTRTIELQNKGQTDPPEWTQKNFEQCPHCSLDSLSHPHCPVALNLVIALERFDHLMSFEKVVVEVIDSERRFVQKTTTQEALSSMIGLLIAGSSCPSTHFFKPMARFHLPFATRDETMWRGAATFLLFRYFTESGIKESDLNLDGLAAIYHEIGQVNKSLVQRLRAATIQDSVINALVHLDVFAKYLTPPLEETMKSIKLIFDVIYQKKN
ncbi:MAG: hypothetical protein GY874_08470 [Desulfobacteraceae bacterium]|nr:hypothetical protein [Desulfobacteraceae bacterium]